MEVDPNVGKPSLTVEELLEVHPGQLAGLDPWCPLAWTNACCETKAKHSETSAKWFKSR